MAQRPGVQVTGATEIRRELKRAGESLRELREINLKAANVVAAEGRQMVPRLTGMLGRTIRPTATNAMGSVWAGKRLVPYAGPIHFGWPARNIAPQPFLYEALDKRGAQVAAKYEEEVARLIAQFERNTPG